jgi:hypothetical protein
VKVSFTLASLDENGVINVWVVCELSAKMIEQYNRGGGTVSESDFGLAIGGKLKVVKSATVRLTSPVPAPAILEDSNVGSAASSAASPGNRKTGAAQELVKRNPAQASSSGSRSPMSASAPGAPFGSVISAGTFLPTMRAFAVQFFPDDTNQ